MDSGVRQILQSIQEEAICIQLDYLLPELRKRRLVTDSEYRKLSDDRRIPDEKNKLLLRLIETKGGERSFDLFVQALEAEKQHTGHEHLAKVLKEAKSALKRRVITPPTPPPKPPKKNTEPSLDTSDYSLKKLSEQLKQIDIRLTTLERDVCKIKEKVLDTSFENTVNLAMQDLHEKVYELILKASQKADDDDDCCKSPVPATSEYDDVKSYTAVSNDYTEEQQYTVVQPQVKLPNVATNKRNAPEVYTSLQNTGEDHHEKKYEKPISRKQYKQNEYVETNILTMTSTGGEFWLAVNIFDNTKVVIKKAAESERAMLGQEVHVLTCCQHPNIIQMITPILSQQIPSLVFEYAEKGQLKNYLKNERERLRESDLIGMAANVACGMAELERQNFVHCNLKASNILLDRDLVCKIASFNQVLCLKGNEQHKVCKSYRIAIRWQPPEVLTEYKYSTKSDVWSFGVFLSELFTYGEKPYPDMKPDEVTKFVLSKKKMSKPNNCPKEIYKLMKECFDTNIERRPTFDILHKQLKKLQSKLYRRSSSDTDEEYT